MSFPIKSTCFVNLEKAYTVGLVGCIVGIQGAASHLLYNWSESCL